MQKESKPNEYETSALDTISSILSLFDTLAGQLGRTGWPADSPEARVINDLTSMEDQIKRADLKNGSKTLG